MTKERKHYIYINPRGFTNEFFVCSVTKDMLCKAAVLIFQCKKGNGHAKFITRKEAEKITAGERRKAREQKKMGLNLAQDPVGATEILPFLAVVDHQNNIRLYPDGI